MDLAAEEYGKAIRARPDDVLSHLKLGEALEKSRDYAGALGEYRSAISIVLDFPEAYYHCGRMLLILKRYVEAEEMFLQALKLKKKYPEVQNSLTLLFLETNQLLKAYESAEKTLAMDGGFAPGIVNMGLVLEQMQRKDAARRYYEKAVKKHGDYDMGHFRLALLLLGEGQTAEAVIQLQSALRANPEFTPAYNELGMIALARGNYQNALRYLRSALVIDSTYAAAYYNMAGILTNQGNYREAALSYKKYLTCSEAPADSVIIQARIQMLLSAENIR
jgi:tetratricopeptide (TPR) repeat protein